MKHKLRRAHRAFRRRFAFGEPSRAYWSVVQATCYRTGGVRRGAKRRGR